MNTGAVATPATVVTTGEPPNVPLAPLVGALKVTLAPEILLPKESFTVAWNGTAKAVRIVAFCGVPAVASRVAGVPEIVRDGVTGRLVEPGDAEALADAIASLMSSPHRRARMGAAARLRAESKFDRRRASVALARLFARSGVPARTPTRLQESPRADRASML